MARIPYLDVSDLEPDDRDLLARPINLFRALAHSPGALRHWYAFGEWARWDSPLDGRLRELAILEVAVLAHSDYAYTHHVVISRQFGVTEADIAAVRLWRPGSSGLGDNENLVLNVARQVSHEGVLDDRLWQRALAVLGVTAAVDLVVIVGFYAMVVRVITALEVDVEPEYGTVLATQPLP